MRFLLRSAAIATAAVLVVLGLSSGGVRGVVGWFLIAWVLWRAWPGLVLDGRRAGRSLRQFKLSRRKPNLYL